MVFPPHEPPIGPPIDDPQPTEAPWKDDPQPGRTPDPFEPDPGGGAGHEDPPVEPPDIQTA